RSLAAARAAEEPDGCDTTNHTEVHARQLPQSRKPALAILIGGPLLLQHVVTEAVILLRVTARWKVVERHGWAEVEPAITGLLNQPELFERDQARPAVALLRQQSQWLPRHRPYLSIAL